MVEKILKPNAALSVTNSSRTQSLGLSIRATHSMQRQMPLVSRSWLFVGGDTAGPYVNGSTLTISKEVPSSQHHTLGAAR
ncbi:hypothetical protein Poly41_48120 [Novipirellula artificiosorum]|uniref:Uncharacterized protein n=1 Tax=Novipirellula artificiosorum TaxID=2528016 RepID=A0A5C6D9L4_9BACT|nr:hypothetical protein Poly41_48120 [Novipirellula artificiosorum]